MDNSHNHGHWFVIGALFSVTMFGALSVMEMNAHRAAKEAIISYQNTASDYTILSEPLMIVIPMLMFLVVALAATKWWYER